MTHIESVSTLTHTPYYESRVSAKCNIQTVLDESDELLPALQHTSHCEEVPSGGGAGAGGSGC